MVGEIDACAQFESERGGEFGLVGVGDGEHGTACFSLDRGGGGILAFEFHVGHGTEIEAEADFGKETEIVDEIPIVTGTDEKREAEHGGAGDDVGIAEHGVGVIVIDAVQSRLAQIVDDDAQLAEEGEGVGEVVGDFEVDAQADPHAGFGGLFAVAVGREEECHVVDGGAIGEIA